MNRIHYPNWASDRTRSENIAVVESYLKSWLAYEPFGALVDSFSEDVSLSGRDLSGTYSQLAELAEVRWDFRGGKERDSIAGNVLAPEQERLVQDVAAQFCMVKSPLVERSLATDILVLGGLVRGCKARWDFASKLVHEDLAKPRFIAGLGANRLLTQGELDFRDQLGLSGATEFEVMVECAASEFPDAVFGPTSSGDPNGPANEYWSEVAAPGDPALWVVSAPSGDPSNRRANTGDTLRWWHDRHGALDRTYLLVTAPIYGPYQGMVGLLELALQRDVSVETVGTSDESMFMGEITQTFSSEQLLQEIGSFVRIVPRFLDVIASG